MTEVPLPQALSPEAPKKLFLDNDKENQETFTDADFTNNLTNAADIPKPARPSSARKHRQTESNLQERLALYQASKKQKNLPLASRVRSKNTLQPIDINANPPGGAPFTPTHKVVSSVSVTPSFLSTPVPASVKINTPQEIASATPATSNSTFASLAPLAKPPRPSDISGKRALGESNEVRLAKERNIARQQELNERESKLNTRGKEIKSREAKLESDQVGLEKQKKAFEVYIAEERGRLSQDKQLHHEQLLRCARLDEEMTRREKELVLERDRLHIEAQETARVRASEIEVLLIKKEEEFAAQCAKRKAEIDASEQERQEEFSKTFLAFLQDKNQFEMSKESFQQEVEELNGQKRQLSIKDNEVQKSEADADAFKVELDKQQEQLQRAKLEFEEERRCFVSDVEKHRTYVIQFEEREAQHQAAVKHAQEVLENSHSLELKFIRDQDTLKQQQKLLNNEREKLISDTLDWQTFKEALIFENEQYKNEALLIAKERERLEHNKRTLAGERAVMQTEKLQLAQDLKQLEARAARTAQEEEALKFSEKRIEAELDQLSSKQKRIEEREIALVASQAAMEKVQKELEKASQHQLESERELEGKKERLEVEFASLCEMRQALSHQQAQLQEQQASLDSREKKTEEDRAKTQRMQALLAAEESMALEREAQYHEREAQYNEREAQYNEREAQRKKQEEEIILMCERMMADIQAKELALDARAREVFTRAEELDKRSAQLEKFQAVFDT